MVVPLTTGGPPAPSAAEAGARLNLGYTRLVAPVGGRIGLRTVDPGNYVAAGATTGIAVITQMDPIDVQFSVPQDSVPEVASRAAAGALTVTALDRSRTVTLDSGRTVMPPCCSPARYHSPSR